MAPGDDDGDDDLLEDGPDFARETRIVDFGQAMPPPGLVGHLSGGEPLPTDKTVRLRTIKGPGQDRITVMNKPIVILGRVEGVADVIVDDEAASRYHASVAHRSHRFILTDLGSTNGTFVNRRPVGDVELKHGDQIRIGITVLAFEIVDK